MSKAEFFRQLDERLKGLPRQEQERIVRVYEDLFQQAEVNGKSERQIVEALGCSSSSSPWSNYATASDRFKQTAESGIRVLVASLALALFNLMFILGPAVAVIAVLFTLSLCSLLLVLSPIWIFAGTGVPDKLTVLLLELFASLAGTGLGLLLSIGMWFADKAFFRLAKAYVRMNLRLIKGE